MGQALASMIKSIDGGDQSAQETREALDSLFELGKSRNDAAWAQATSNAISVYANINQVLLRRQSIVASASTNTDGIVQGINKAVGKLMSGQVLDGVTDILSSALNVVLGSSSGQVSQNYTYALIATELGALLRIDIDVYSFELRSQGLQSKAKNMTAITSLVSSVDITKLQLNDLRAIVSMTFGNSPLERQQQIYSVILAAYKEAVKPGVAEAGGVLPSDAQERVKALFVPSQYEASMKQRGVPLVAAPSQPARETPKIGRLDLKDALQKHRSSAVVGKLAVLKMEDGGDSPKDPATPATDPTQWTDLILWVSVIKQVDVDWISRFSSAVAGFNEPDVFEFVEIVGGKSGSAISFRCRANSVAGLFDLSLRYCYETVLPTVNTYRGLVEAYIANVALQYTHPSESGSGLVTVISFKRNQIHNNSSNDITFVAAKTGRELGTIKKGEKATLTGDTHHIVAPSHQKGGEAPETDQWVTYQTFERSDIIIEATMAVTDLEGGGYRLTGYTTHDRIFNIDYSEEWQGVDA
ncbi:hypothetical protein B0T26DRAFT_765421 [Lasiosphaeria miniovina]|uniref:Uncharacterized protein n=1 Tax=Lasiosphaeria miniovina TaxID=1954250 RepID=A0AA40B4D8_9PEZI|nr:uncharacterized protein B0T26DRAFT_765421 [Lasiosphaeria miniovina]KAK0727456.1 hypothetical protein B0T26DRAFT_765421 [Lasiosphaeria miniovina]